MSKKIIIAFCLVALSLSLSLTVHNDEATTTAAVTTSAVFPPSNTATVTATTTTVTPAPSTPSGQPSPFGPQTPESQAAIGRLTKFIKKNKDLRKAMESGAEPNERQLAKLVKFMLADPFFQTQLIDSVKSSPENKWIEKLDKPAQLRFLKIITEVTPTQLQNPKILNRIVNKLKADKDIGAALKAQFGDNLDANAIAGISSSLKPIAAHHALVAATEEEDSDVFTAPIERN